MKRINLWQETNWIPFEYESIADIKAELDKRKILVLDSVTLGDNITVGFDCVIRSNSEIGSGTTIGNNVYVGESVSIGNDVSIGDNTIIQGNSRINNGCSIGNDVILSKDCFITSNCTIQNTIRITGSRDNVNWFGDDQLQIGCMKASLEEWLETFQSVGEQHKYSPKQIEEYHTYINVCNTLTNTIKTR